MISPKPTPLVLLAPMEGLLDFVLRDILTRVGGIDRCVSEFIRITDQLLPERVFIRVVPELLNGSARRPVCRCVRHCWVRTPLAWQTTPPDWRPWVQPASI